MAEESAQPIQQLKTTIIRASIHCQGCRRKVEKILSQIHGVEHVHVDAQQHKVTVTGNVDADTLIRKLVKSGKNAELWPQISQHRINPAIGKKKEIETQGKKVDGAPPASDNNGATTEAETAAPVKAGDGDGDGDVGRGGGGDAKADNGPAAKKTNGDVNVPVKKSEEESNCKSEERCAAAPEKSDGGGNGGESGTSAKKKKKKKRAQIGNPDGGLENGETNESHPRHHGHGFAPAPAVYAVSYNTAYPSSSYTASCYAAPPPHGYAYVHQGHQMEEAVAPSDPELNPRQPLDSFELFSDENPNGCFIM